MSGTFEPLNPPARAGFFNRIMAAAEAMAVGGAGGVVAIPISHNWGPEGEFHRIKNQREFENLYGASATDSSFAVIGALTGDGTEGSGASEVLVYRMDLDGNIAATLELLNVTPATGLTLTAKYKGTLGNSLTVTIQAHPTLAATDQMLMYLNGALVEQYSYAEADVDDLAAQINDESGYVTAVANVGNVQLAAVVADALESGANDADIVSGDWTAAMTALEGEQFNIVLLPNLTDDTIMDALEQWVEDINASNQRILAVVGGSASETFSDATTRALSYSDNPNMVTLGRNTFVEAATGTTRSTAQMVGYVAGMIAAAGARSSITFSRLIGFDLGTTVSNDEVVDAIKAGFIVFTRDAVGVRVEKGITTFTDTSDVEMPTDVYSQIKSVRTIHLIENDLTRATEDEWIGQIPNTPATRQGYVGMILAYFRELEDENILKKGQSSVELDPTQDNTSDTLWPIYRVEMASAIERVLALGVVSL